MKGSHKYFIYVLIISYILLISSSLFLQYNRVVDNSLLSMFKRVDNAIFDNLMKERPQANHKTPIVVVAIDEKSLDKLGRWQSWPRRYYAELLHKMQQYQAKIVAFDIVFDGEDENAGVKYLNEMSQYFDHKKQHSLKQDQYFLNLLDQAKRAVSTDWMFEQAIEAFENELGHSVVLGYFVAQQSILTTKAELHPELKKVLRSSIPFRPQGQMPEMLNYQALEYGINYSKLSKKTHRHGYFSMSPDFDGVVRHYSLLRGYYGQLFPSLALKVYESYIHSSPVVEWIDRNVGVVSFSGNNKMFPIATDGLMRIHYYGPQNSYHTVSLSDVIDETDEIEVNFKNQKSKIAKSEILKDAIILVGATAIGIYDVRATPVQANLPGVEVHANVIAQLLNSEMYQELNDVFIIKYLLAFGVMLSLFTYLIMRKSLLWSVLYIIAYYFFTFYYFYDWLFKHKIILYLFPSLSIVFLHFVILNIYKYFLSEKENSFIKKTFQSYVSPEVAKAMLDNPEKIKLGGEFKVLSILFSDVEGFTTIAEKMSPVELTQSLNEYLTSMTDQVFKTKGTLDKYIGDAVMAFWGAPLDDHEHAKHAVECALQMIKNEKDFRTRIGINTGRVSVGNMGSVNQFAYTMIGDAVNLASRLENLNKYYNTQILISESTYELIQNDFVCRHVDRVSVVGKSQVVNIYEVLDFVENRNQYPWLESFDMALKSYLSGEFELAIQRFSESQLINDYIAKIMLERCELLMLDPSDWNGVWAYNIK